MTFLRRRAERKSARDDADNELLAALIANNIRLLRIDATLATLTGSVDTAAEAAEMLVAMLQWDQLDDATKVHVSAYAENIRQELAQTTTTISYEAMPSVEGFTPERYTKIGQLVLEQLRSVSAQSIDIDLRPNGSLWFNVTFAQY